MKFRTIIPIKQADFKLDYDAKIVSLGSCFAENMSQKFDYFKFQNTTNPLGIVFHPLAIEKLIDFAVSEKIFTSKDVFFLNERWHCFDVHSDLSNSNQENLIKNLNVIIQLFKQKLQEATVVIITYGTSWIYRNIESNQVVANCHKLPSKHFSKELLQIETIQNAIENTVILIQKINPKVHFIFTVSPVRHIKDGFVENQVSKANLISALFSSRLQLQNISYFPSYEIVMDELRDYRFYNQDMLHPNQVAVDYIWERYYETYFSEEAVKIMKEVDSIQKSLNHKAFDENSESHQNFLKKLEIKIESLQKVHSNIKF